MLKNTLSQSDKEDIVVKLQEFIQICSTKAPPAHGAPFGQGIHDALDWILQLGVSMGFTAKNINGYAGSLEFGTGKLFGILGHIDVVPEGEGWSVPPYSGLIRDGKVYGRGALDDKGPTLAALYAMKRLKDSGLPLKRTIRLILGTDEESGWEDMEVYTKHEALPIEGFAPDGGFPLIHAEKGILHIELQKKLLPLPHVVSIIGGERANVVPDLCTILLKNLPEELLLTRLSQYTPPPGVSLEIKTQETTGSMLMVNGLGAHGSLPHKGKNACLYGLDFLQTLPLEKQELALIQWILSYPGNGYEGEGFQINFEDEVSGKLSLNVGICELKYDHLRLVLDIRYPVTVRSEQILEQIRGLCSREKISVHILSEQYPHHVPKNSLLVQTLLSAYEKVTGRDAYAYAIGGGTYAKVMRSGVAFGPTFPGEPELAHCADEYIAIDHLYLMTEIYAQALFDIATEPR